MCVNKMYMYKQEVHTRITLLARSLLCIRAVDTDKSVHGLPFTVEEFQRVCRLKSKFIRFTLEVPALSVLTLVKY